MQNQEEVVFAIARKHNSVTAWSAHLELDIKWTEARDLLTRMTDEGKLVRRKGIVTDIYCIPE